MAGGPPALPGTASWSAGGTGDDLHFHEKGQTDKATGRYDFVVHPSRGNITITGYQAVEPLGTDRLTRIVHFDIDAKLPLGVGKVVETFVRSALQRSYDESATLIGKYLRGELGCGLGAPRRAHGAVGARSVRSPAAR